MTVFRYFIDFEANQHSKGPFYLKELCIMDVEKPLRNLCIVFTAPKPWCRTTEEERKTYSYNERRLHHLNWYEGNAPFDAKAVASTIDWYTGNMNALFFAQNAQKTTILQELLPDLNIINYADLDERCREVTLAKLPHPPDYITCTYRDHGRHNCAVLKCYRFCMHYYDTFLM